MLTRMILYPTETIYGLGVNAFDQAAIDLLFDFKGRDTGKSASWLVRDISDIERWAELSYVAQLFVEQYLPGPLTLVVPAKPEVADKVREADGTVSFRISSDPVARRLITEFMAEHDAPLTCTSANVSGLDPCDTPTEILAQFTAAGRDTDLITQVIDEGSRSGQSSTVVRVIGDEVTVLRQGSVRVG